jgi:hypothetical protein
MTKFCENWNLVIEDYLGFEIYSRGRVTWENGNAKYAATSTIQKREIPMAIFLLRPPMKNSQKVGSAQSVVLPKTCLKRFNFTLSPSFR